MKKWTAQVALCVAVLSVLAFGVPRPVLADDASTAVTTTSTTDTSTTTATDVAAAPADTSTTTATDVAAAPADTSTTTTTTDVAAAPADTSTTTTTTDVAAAPAATDASTPAATDASAPAATDASAPAATDASTPAATDASAPAATDASTPAATDASTPATPAADDHGAANTPDQAQNQAQDQTVPATLPPQAQAPAHAAVTFSDAPGHWAQSAIQAMADAGVVNGYPDGSFKPENHISRADFAVMLARLLKLPTSTAALSFTDNDKIPGYAAEPVAAAVSAGLIRGRNNGAFDPTAEVTRAEASIMLARALKAAGKDLTAGNPAFNDAIPSWATVEILASARYGLVTGYPDGSFQAGKSLNRAEAVTMLARLQTLTAQQ